MEGGKVLDPQVSTTLVRFPFLCVRLFDAFYPSNFLDVLIPSVYPVSHPGAASSVDTFFTLQGERPFFPRDMTTFSLSERYGGWATITNSQLGGQPMPKLGGQWTRPSSFILNDAVPWLIPLFTASCIIKSNTQLATIHLPGHSYWSVHLRPC